MPKDILSYDNYLFVHTHFDDEIGTIHLMRSILQNSKNVTVGYISDCNGKGERHRRILELGNVLDMAGVDVKHRRFFDIPERHELEYFSDIIGRLEDVIRRLKPDCLVTVDYEGGHEAHDATSFCVTAVAEKCSIDLWTYSSSYLQNGKRVYMRDFIPGRNGIVRIETDQESRQIKQKAIRIYESQFFGVDKINDESKKNEIFSREFYRFIDTPVDFHQPPHKEVAYAVCHPSPLFTFNDFLSAVKKYEEENE